MAEPPRVQRWYVYSVLFGTFFASSFLRPEMPGLLLGMFGGDLSAVATYQGVCDAVGAILAFLLVPYLGAVSDKRGRRPALVATALASSANVLVLALDAVVGLSHQTLLWTFFAANLFSKVTTQSIAFSYVADASGIEQRSYVLLEAGAVIYVFSTAGPFAAIALTNAGLDNPRRTAILLSAALSALSVVAAYLIPESKKLDASPSAAAAAAAGHGHATATKSYGAVEADHSHDGAAAAPAPASRGCCDPVGRAKCWSGFVNAFAGATVGLRFLLGGPAAFRLLAVICTTSQVAIMGVGQVYYLYLVHDFGFTRTDNGIAAILGSVLTCALMVAQLWLSRRVAMATLMAVSMSAFTVYCVGLSAVAHTRGEVFALIPFFGLAHLMYTSASALLATLAPPDKLGLAMSALSGIKAFASGLGPIAFALLFARMAARGPDDAVCLWGMPCTAMPLMLGAALALVAMVGCLFLPVVVQSHKRHVAADNVRAQGKAVHSAGAGAGATPAGGAHSVTHSAPGAAALRKFRRALLRLMSAHRAAAAGVTLGEDHYFLPSHIAVDATDLPTPARSPADHLPVAQPIPVTVQVAPPVEPPHPPPPGVTLLPPAPAALHIKVLSPLSSSSSSSSSSSGGDAVASAKSANLGTNAREWAVLSNWMRIADRGRAARSARHNPAAADSMAAGSSDLTPLTAPSPVPTPVPAAAMTGVPTIHEEPHDTHVAVAGAHDHDDHGHAHDHDGHAHEHDDDHGHAHDDASKEPATTGAGAPLEYRTSAQRVLLTAALLVFVAGSLFAISTVSRAMAVPPTGPTAATGKPVRLSLTPADDTMRAATIAAAVAMGWSDDGAGAGTNALTVDPALTPASVGDDGLDAFEDEDPIGDRELFAELSGTLLAAKNNGKAKGKGKGNKAVALTPAQKAAIAAADAAPCTGSGTPESLAVIALFGPPGVGKGALSRHLMATYNDARYPQRLLHLSTGDMIREEMADPTSAVGQRVSGIVRSGGLVDDDTVLQLLEAKFARIAAANVNATAAHAAAAAARSGKGAAAAVCGLTRGVLLDGYPRRVSQLQLIDGGAYRVPRGLTALVSITMRDDVLAERRAGRRLCPKCGRSYNLAAVDHDGYRLAARAPRYRNPDLCSVDRTPLVTRPDDAPAIAEHRMVEYHAEADGILQYFRATIAGRNGAGAGDRPFVPALVEVEKTRSARQLFQDTVHPQLATSDAARHHTWLAI